MSLQVNLSSREILQAYQDVLNSNGIDWALFTYEKGTNDLKVQSTGSGGLEEEDLAGVPIGTGGLDGREDGEGGEQGGGAVGRGGDKLLGEGAGELV